MSERFVAFLRGINLGRRRVKMEALSAAFVGLGLADVTTLIASGNVVFSVPTDDPAALTAEIEAGLRRALGFPVPTIVRTLVEVQALIERDPFADVAVTKETRRYLTLLAAPTASGLALPYDIPGGGFTILSRTDREVFSVLTLGEGAGTVDGMAVLEREYGTEITTRNWNTILKLPLG